MVVSQTEKVTGLSRAQVTRLIGRYAESGIVRSRQGRGKRFTARYNPGDIALLAEVDEAHENAGGTGYAEDSLPAVSRIRRSGYERLAEISVAHIYNLRKRRSYREHRMVFTKTRPHAGRDRRGPQARTRRAARLCSPIVINRKVGNQVFYSIRDPALIEVLDILRNYFYSQLSRTVTMLDEVGRAGAK